MSAENDPDAAAIEAGRRLFAGECRFFYAAQRLDEVPPAAGPEVAFAGRSNVGKSSLLNALTGRRGLARISQAPGRTRQLNFFRLAERLTLVDMPGYGFARAPRSIARDWQTTMFEYLRGRPTLRRVLLLIDGRIGAKDNDAQVMTLLDRAAVTFQLVITKADELSPSELGERHTMLAGLGRTHPAAHPVVIATSSREGMGMEQLRAELAGLA